MRVGIGGGGSSLGGALIITNPGTATLTITQITESGGAFSVSGYALPLNVGAGQQSTINVAFMPASAGLASSNNTILEKGPPATTTVSLSLRRNPGNEPLGDNPREHYLAS